MRARRWFTPEPVWTPLGSASAPRLPYLVALGLVIRHLAFGASLLGFKLWLYPFEVCDLDSGLAALCLSVLLCKL